MKWSQSYIYTLKEAPADAEISSHKLLVRGGFIRKTAPGVHTYQNLALRALRKIENIIREELDKRGCVEILMPVVQPKEIWEESGRWGTMGDGLLKFKNRNNQDFCLGPTHEEVVTDIVRKDIRSYRDLPKNLYQIQNKYRDEIRPRFGLMRGREFCMKDAYSFDQNEAAALKSYDLMYNAYKSIFNRLGLDYRIVEADAGNIGGSRTHEFQVLAGAGEDHLMVCDTCDFAANIEVAPVVKKDAPTPAPGPAIEEFATPNLRTIDDLALFLKVPAETLVKTLFFAGPNEEAIVVLLRGNDELNPIKLKNILGMSNPPLLLNEKEVLELTGAHPGSCGPVHLKARIIMDQGLIGMSNFVVGANKDDFHLKNVVPGRDFKFEQIADLRMARAGDACPQCTKSSKSGKYKSLRGIEVGHVFYLGTKYSKSMGANYLNAEGKPTLIEMGCYGIGVSRSLQAAVEQNHDADGICWPVAIAPYDLHVCLLDPTQPKLSEWVAELESGLSKAGITALIDDRDERPGVKFKDADLIGLPYRLNVGSRGFDGGELELVTRKGKVVEKISPSQVLAVILEKLGAR